MSARCMTCWADAVHASLRHGQPTAEELYATLFKDSVFHQSKGSGS